MHHRRTVLPALWGLALCWGLASPVQARDASSYKAQELFDALVERFSRVLLASPTHSSPAPDMAVILLEGKALPLAALLRDTPRWRVLTQEQLVAEQRAVFLIVTQLGAQGPDMLVDYEVPTNASWGTLRIQAQDGKLVFRSEDSYRSSSGARATYARLYGGVACRYGTEMAYRDNFYTRSRESGTCARAAFPAADAAQGW